MSHDSKLPLRGPLGALMFGNFVVACGVLVVPGMLDRLAQDLQVSVPTAGQLLSLAALAMCLGAPLFAAFTSRVDRRLLLTASLLVLGIGHVACALAPSYTVLAVLRPLSVLGAAVLTPQAAATIGLLVPAAQRPAAVTTVFLGWSVASVVGMPLGNLVANWLSWRAGFGLIAVMAFVSAAIVWRSVPGGLRVAPLSFQSWLDVAGSPRLRRILGTTLLWCAGHFMVLGYITPLFRHFLAAPPGVQAALLALMGLSGLAGNVLLTRWVGRIGPDRGSRLSLALVAAGLALWCVFSLVTPSLAGMALVVLVWGGGSFAFVSAQQARLGASAPALASASIALNSSSLYAGQALGATAGGALLATLGYGALGPAGLVTVLLALGLCVLADRGESHANGR